jgi:hypothetical protein
MGGASAAVRIRHILSEHRPDPARLPPFPPVVLVPWINLGRNQMTASRPATVLPRAPGFTRQPDRRRRPDLPARLSRARLIYLLGRSGQPLTDWLPLGLAGVVVGLMFAGGSVI